MTEAPQVTTVNIRPDVGVLSVLRHLNYTPWYAMAEFVDNAFESYRTHRDELAVVDGQEAILRVSIEIDPNEDGSIVIRDNAAGIYEHEYERAFRAAEVPPDSTGLSEFGMGMKSAACWFGQCFSVRSKALGELVERTVYFDVEQVVNHKLHTLAVESATAPKDTHYTEVVLSRLHKTPQGRTLGKIKEHLASIYRIFLDDGLMELSLNGEALEYVEPAILNAPHYKTPNEPPTRWEKDIEFDLGRGLQVHGFAALRQTASTSHAGFALFRRRRLIQGSGDEPYRPHEIFADPNSYVFQRLFGELHLEGFQVSHTKDGFRWDENEEAFLQLLKEHLNSAPVPLLDQARGYRVRPRVEEVRSGAEVAVENTAEVVASTAAPILEQQVEAAPESNVPPEVLPAASTSSSRVIELDMRDTKWRVTIELSSDPAVGDWLTVFDSGAGSNGGQEAMRELGMRLSLAHPFMDRFGGVDSFRIEPLLRVAVALALAEVTARESGVRSAGTIRRNVNELLRDTLSKP